MVLSIRSVTRRYGETLALDSVSLRVRRGDCYGLLGHNGAGKSTLMRIVLGWIPASSGSVLLDGFDIRRYPREARARLGGLIEVPSFYGALSGARNLEGLSRLAGRSVSEARGEAGRLLELVGLAAAARRPVQEWSLGMKQRLGIARALIGDPELILLDEPTSGLDPEGIADLREWLRRLVQVEGKTILLSSHRLTELDGLCNRVGILRQGRVVLESSIEELSGVARGEYLFAGADEPGQARVERQLVELGLETEALEGTPPIAGARQVRLAGADAAQVSAGLCAAGEGLRLWMPRPVNLEDVYARATRAASAPGAGADSGAGARAQQLEPSNEQPRAQPPAQPPAQPQLQPTSANAAQREVSVSEATAGTAPKERRAPSGPTGRVFAHELSLMGTHRTVLASLLAPALAAGVAVARRAQVSQANVEAIGGEQLYSDTAVTAFEAYGVGMSAGLPLLALFLVALSSQTLAAELGRGTLRNLLLAPLTRAQLVLGKTGALLAFTLASYAFLVAAALGVAAWLFDFQAVVEILPGGLEFPLVPVEELWPQLQRALIQPLLPLVAFCGIGLAASALSRSGAFALGLSLSAVLCLELLRGIARGFGGEAWIPTAHIPSPLGDSSYIGSYQLAVTGVSNVEYALGAASLAAPLTWFFLACALAVWTTRRRFVS